MTKHAFTVAALAIPVILAFPANLDAAAMEKLAHGKRQTPISKPPFDAKTQYVPNTGKYAFRAPSATDARGPCPGLNAMANHGYMPHNGVGGMSDYIDGTFASFGMAADLAEFLAVYGAIFTGNLLEYSIGGPVATLTNGGGLLGEPMGLSGSHNSYEGDVSVSRPDLFLSGDDVTMKVERFKELYELGMQNGGHVDLDLLTDHRSKLWDESIKTNPYFFSGPFSGSIANGAAWSFVFRFMGNKSAEHPEGYLDLETLKAFYSVTGDYPNFVFTPGYERFPDNYYKRNDIDAYTIPYVLSDILTMAAKYPKFASIGGNTNGVNTFVGIDPADATGGVLNGPRLLEGNNLWCYALEFVLETTPDALSGIFIDINPAMDKLGSAISKATNDMNCPKLDNLDKGQFSQYPGYTKLNRGKYLGQ